MKTAFVSSFTASRGSHEVVLDSIACIIFGPALLSAQFSAQSPDGAENFLACTHGYMSCDLARLSQSQANAVALAEHRRNVANASMLRECDHAHLTRLDAEKTAMAERRRNLSRCTQGYDVRDHVSLSHREAGALGEIERQRNVSNCDQGYRDCDRAD